MNHAIGFGTFYKSMIVAIDKHDIAKYSKKDRAYPISVRNRLGMELDYSMLLFKL
ncbi:MAG: hypothetical protein QXT71_04125 [Thermoplasmata archaeon]